MHVIKMEYFILTSDNDLPFVYGDAKFQPIDQGVYSNLWHDRKLPAGAVASITLIKSVKKLNRDLFSVNAGFVSSKKLLTVLKSGFRSKFESVPADVYYHSGEKVEGEFFFLEFDCWVDAFDYENSRFVRDDDEESKVVECDYLQIDSKKRMITIYFSIEC